MRKKDIVVTGLQSPHRVKVRVSGWVNKTLFFYFKILLLFYFLTMFLNLNMFHIISMMIKVLYITLILTKLFCVSAFANIGRKQMNHIEL